jgi:hypothetical protein
VERIEGGESKLSTKEVFLKPELIIRKTCGFHLKGYQLKELEKEINSFSLGHLTH